MTTIVLLINTIQILFQLKSYFEDLPDGKAIGGQVQWNTASKANKKKVIIISTSPSFPFDDRSKIIYRGYLLNL